MSFIYLYKSDSDYCLKINFQESHPKFNDYYYGYCASLNELINTFYYSRDLLEDFALDSQEWIFILREITNKHIVTKIPEKIIQVNMKDITSFGKAMHSLRCALRNQMKLEIALYHQKHRLRVTMDINMKRCRRDPRFITESLSTTNRIHKQRVKNLQEKLDKIKSPVESIAHIRDKLEWLIFIESNFISEDQASEKKPKTSSIDIISKAWEILIGSDQGAVAISNFTQE